MSTRILLVRHGQSEWNALGRWQGQADPPLSDLGRQQALSAARALGALDAIFSSDLLRAAETAEIVAETLGVGPVVFEPSLRERHAGEWSGLTRAEIDQRYPGYLAPIGDKHSAFAAGDANERRPPGWEPDASVLERALDALGRIHSSVGDGDVLAVTHGGLIYVLEHHLDAEVHRLANGGGRWIAVDGDQLMLGDRVLLVNDDGTPVTVPSGI